jgi:hypothetical protein
VVAFDHPLRTSAGFVGFVEPGSAPERREGDVILGSDIARLLAGPFLGACALLAIAGAGKILKPAPARAAVLAAGLRIPRSGVVAFGFVELGTGGAGALLGGRSAFAVAACYLLLMVFAVRLLLRAPTTPCACLGSSNAVVTRTHVAVDVAAACIAIAAASGGSPIEQLGGRWLAGAVFVVLVACCVRLVALALEELAQLGVAAKEGTT